MVILVCVMGIGATAQDKTLALRLYLSPAICRTFTQYRVLSDGVATLNNLTKSSGVFFGGGVAVLKNIDENWLIGGDIGFVSKGDFAIRDSVYHNGGFGGTSFTREELNFLQTLVFVERQKELKNKDDKLLFASGIFYGMRFRSLIGYGLDVKAHDFGTSVSLGIQHRRFFTKIDYQMGLVNIKNAVGSEFKTNILSFKIGYSVL